MVAALAFSVAASDPSDPDSPGKITWGEEVAVQADDLVRSPGGEDRGAVDKAEGWLRDLLAKRPILSKQVLDEGKAAGFGRSTLYKAKQRLGVRARRVGGVGARGEWTWELPGEEFREEPPLRSA